MQLLVTYSLLQSMGVSFRGPPRQKQKKKERRNGGYPFCLSFKTTRQTTGTLKKYRPIYGKRCETI